MSSRLLAYIKPLILHFWKICLLKKGPEETPFSSTLLVILLIFGFLLDNLRINLLIPELTYYQLAGVLLVHTLLMLLLTAGLLAIFGYRTRIVQTLTALGGTGIILSALILPFDYVTNLTQGKFTMASIISLFVQIWSLVVVGHILSSALSVHRLTGIVISIGFYILGIAAFTYLLPATG
ncbi:MAG: hypothetical protein PVG50_07530 [Thiohalophilus sp.]|jgi:hypothetical protein